MNASEFWNSDTTISIAICAMMGIAFLVIGAIVIVRMLRTPAGKRQLMEFNNYKELANEQRESNRELHEELLVLKEKIDSIEKMLKEVQ